MSSVGPLLLDQIDLIIMQSSLLVKISITLASGTYIIIKLFQFEHPV